MVSQFFELGQKTGANNFYYNLDHLGSVREVTNSSGTIVTQVAYSPWGEPTLLQGSTLPDFGYAGYYNHPRSGLNLTLYRAYSPGLVRWLSRDPLGETAGINLYGYAANNPISFVDPLGLYDYSQQETQRILNESAEQANSGTLSGLGAIAWNSLWAKDYGYIPKSKNDTFCIKGQKLDAYQFTNFLAGYSARQYDQTFQGLPALGTLKAVGLGWHVLGYGIRVTLGPERAASFTRGYWDLLNTRGGADIEAGAWYAHDPSRLKPGKGSGYDDCGCK